MAVVPDSARVVPPVVVAALLLAARSFQRDAGLLSPSESDVLDATGAGRSRAYELRNELIDSLPALNRPTGGPRATPPTPQPSRVADLVAEVLHFVMARPGCVYGATGRRGYADVFRAFIIELRHRHEDLDLVSFSGAVQVPLGTLEDWLRPGRSSKPQPPPSSKPDTDDTALGLRIQTVLDAWNRWRGTFVDLCQHLRQHLRVPFGRARIASILNAGRLRKLRRRPGRSPDEAALRGAFETFFPGAQWVGDGMKLPVRVDGQSYSFNVEFHVDAFSAAIVGVSLRDEEDAQAVTDAFEDGVQTTDEPPISLLLDNRPSNHAPEVDEALGDTIKTRATIARAQNKGHVEGAFGLFQRDAPPLEIEQCKPREIARQLAQLVVITWARTINHRPRKKRGGKTRVQLYQNTPVSPEQLREARRLLRERQ